MATSPAPPVPPDPVNVLLADVAAMRARAVSDRRWAREAQLRAVDQRRRVASTLQELKVSFEDRVRTHEQRGADRLP